MGKKGLNDMQEWAPAIVTGVISLVSCGITYGMLTQRVTDNTDDIVELKKSKGEQWTEINSLGNRVTKVEAICEERHVQARTAHAGKG